jgi:hypothetical protein
MKNVIKNKTMKWWLRIGLFSILFVGIGTFAYLKMNFLVHGVEISATLDHQGFSSVALINGNAANAVFVSLNGREIFIDKNGNFTESVALLPGLSVVTLEAQDKFGKAMEKKFEVMYTESTGVVALGQIVENRF